MHLAQLKYMLDATAHTDLDYFDFGFRTLWIVTLWLVPHMVLLDHALLLCGVLSQLVEKVFFASGLCVVDNVAPRRPIYIAQSHTIWKLGPRLVLAAATTILRILFYTLWLGTLWLGALWLGTLWLGTLWLGTLWLQE